MNTLKVLVDGRFVPSKDVRFYQSIGQSVDRLCLRSNNGRGNRLSGDFSLVTWSRFNNLEMPDQSN